MTRFLRLVAMVCIACLFASCSQSLPRVQTDESPEDKLEAASGIIATDTFVCPTATALQVRWSDASDELVIAQANTLVHMRVSGEDGTTVNLYGGGADAPYSPSGTNVSLSWNDHMVFAAGCNNAPTRIVNQDGKTTFVNAALFTADGRLVRVFPAMQESEIKKQREPFERSVMQDVALVTWLDEDRFVVNTRARIYVYSVSSDELTLVSDMIEAVRAGFTIYVANSFGSGQGWAMNGLYYYTACLQLVDGQNQRDLLYVVNRDNTVSPVYKSEELPAYPRYHLENNTLIMYDDYYSEQNVWHTRISYANMDDRKLYDFLDMQADYNVFTDGRFLTAIDYDWIEGENGQITMGDSKFCCYDSHNDVLYRVLQNDLGLTQPKGQYYFNLLSLDTQDEDNPTLIFSASDYWVNTAANLGYSTTAIYKVAMNSGEVCMLYQLPQNMSVYRDYYEDYVSPDGRYVYCKQMRFDGINQSDNWDISVLSLS